MGRHLATQCFTAKYVPSVVAHVHTKQHEAFAVICNACGPGSLLRSIKKNVNKPNSNKTASCAAAVVLVFNFARPSMDVLYPVCYDHVRYSLRSPKLTTLCKSLIGAGIERSLVASLACPTFRLAGRARASAELRIC